MSDYLHDRSGRDPEVERLEALLGAFAHNAPLAEPPVRRSKRWMAIAVSSAAIAAAVSLFLVLREPRAPHSATQVASVSVEPTVESEPPGSCMGGGFSFQVAGGAASCDDQTVRSGTLPIGGWLETPEGATAEVQVADIGDLTMYGGSRLRLVGTGPDQHRLELARGRLSARVVAPPRLFVIDTPVAAVVDLGCAYDLEVDAERHTHLSVTAGAVSLEGHGREVYVPVGMAVIAAPGRGPGLPVATGAAPALRAAVERFDAGDSTAVAEIVEAATRADAFTLWHMLARTTGADRLAVFRKLDQVAHLPVAVRKQDVLACQPGALEAWRDEIDSGWMR